MVIYCDIWDKLLLLIAQFPQPGVQSAEADQAREPSSRGGCSEWHDVTPPLQ